MFLWGDWAMDEVRLIDANTAMNHADKCYNDWNLAMAAAEGTRQINMVYKKQELFKAVKKVIESCPSIDPRTACNCGGVKRQKSLPKRKTQIPGQHQF